MGSISRAVHYMGADGNLYVCHPVISSDDPKGFTEEQAFQRAQKDIPPDAINPTQILVANLPQDRTFRGAWKQDGNGGITHDMVKARDILRAIMRQARAPLLAQLDQDYMRADETNDVAAKAQIAAKKNVLRNVTALPAIDNAQTPDQLKAVWPANILGGMP